MKEKRLIYILFITSIIINTILVINHSMWRDEAQAWLIARDTTLTAKSLFTVTSYEGHPFLWFLMLMPFAKLGFPFFTVKAISAICMVIALYLFLFKVDLHILIKLIAINSPMFFYSYWVPARSYSLAALLMIALLVLYKQREEKPILYGIVLALLLQTLIIYAGFVFGCSICWLFNTLHKICRKDIKNWIQHIIGLSTVLVSALFLLWEFRYTDSAIKAMNVDSANGLIENMQRIIFCLCDCFRELFSEYYVFCIFIVIVITMISIYVTHSYEIMVMFIAGLIWQVWIYTFVYPHVGNGRLVSFLYIILFVVGTSLTQGDDIIILGKCNYRNFIQVALFILLICGMRYDNSGAFDELNPDNTYSTSKEIASVINSLPTDSSIYISSSDYESAVVAQIDTKHKIWNPFTGKEASYKDRNPDAGENIGFDEFIDKARKMSPDNKEIYLVSVLDEGKDGIRDLSARYYEEDSVEGYYCSVKNSITDEYFIILRIQL